jgi:hypothetical protein
VLYRIPTKNINSAKIERLFVTIGVAYSLIYGQGADDCAPESTITIEFSGVARSFAASIAQIIQHWNQDAVLITEEGRPFAGFRS